MTDTTTPSTNAQERLSFQSAGAVRKNRPDTSDTLYSPADHPAFNAIKRAAIHCLEVSVPGLSEDMRRVIAINIARRAVHNMSKD
jgi:hypothetical protein